MLWKAGSSADYKWIALDQPCPLYEYDPWRPSINAVDVSLSAPGGNKYALVSKIYRQMAYFLFGAAQDFQRYTFDLPVRNSSGQDKESHTTAEEGRGDNGIKAAIKKSQ